MVFSLLLIFSLCPGFIIQFFDQKGTFTSFSAKIFPLLSVFVFLDLLQLVLSGALRGACDVHMVMWTRLIVCAGFFCPVTYVVATFFPLVDPMLKFLIIYVTFYVGSGIMSIVYVCLFRTGEWSKRSREDKTV
jgi:Na+-driven multidrug efflux pump